MTLMETRKAVTSFKEAKGCRDREKPKTVYRSLTINAYTTNFKVISRFKFRSCKLRGVIFTHEYRPTGDFLLPVGKIRVKIQYIPILLESLLRSFNPAFFTSPFSFTPHLPPTICHRLSVCTFTVHKISK